VSGGALAVGGVRSEPTASGAASMASGAEHPVVGVKIAYVCSEYPAISHTFVLREVQALRRRGVEIATFTIRRTDPAKLLSQADRAASASTFAILPPRWRRLLGAHLELAWSAPRTYLATVAGALRHARPGLRGRLWRLFYFVESVALWHECRRLGVRHIHVHFANAAADVAMLATRVGAALEPERGWSWSFTMHGPTELFDVRHFALAQKARDARFVVCISDFARSQLMTLTAPETWEKFHVVHVGIPVDQFTPAQDVQTPGAPAQDTRTLAAGLSAQTPSTEQTILCVGRLVPEKGQAVLLEALAQLAARGCAVRATFAGAGDSRAALERLAERLGVASQATFTGPVGQEEIRELYEDASIFCLPSFAEGVPVVLMEAMAMGLPAVSTRIAGIPELIEDGRTGLLVAPGRQDELAAALERLLGDASLRRELGVGAREKVLAEFDAAASATQLQALFAERL
jgi:colanic acid/amylovoran biosynthesis glycosyltransferase